MKKYIILFILSFVLLSIPISSLADEKSTTSQKESIEETTKETLTGLCKIDKKYYYFNKAGKKQTGWKKLDGKIYYFKEKGGAAYTGRVKIDGKYFYFNSKGVLKTGFLKIEGKRYYFQEKGKLGVIGSSLKGLKKINGKYYYFKSSGEVFTGTKKIEKKWYFFNKKGVRQSKTVKEDGITYYISAKGHLEAYKKKKTYYKPNGKKMNKYEKDDYTTFQTARSIVDEITTSKMSKKEKLKVCFKWVMKKPYRMRRKFTGATGWPALYANDHFKRGGGDCHADASALAYLARAIGYTDVYVCIDANDSRIARSHSWAQINGYVYDPLFAQSKSYSKYYGAIKKYAMGKERVAIGYE